MADAVLAFGEHMDEEPADELVCLEGHDLVPAWTIHAIVLDAEGDASRIEADQTAIGYRDAVRVARQVGQHNLWSGEGFLGVDHPVDFAQRLQESVEGGPIGKFGMVAEELQLSGLVQLGQSFQNEPPVEPGQNPNGEEEVPAAGDPFCTIRRQSTSRHDHVDMGVVCHCRTPSVQHRRHTDLCAQMLRIGGDLDHGIGTRAHQQIVDCAFVLVGDVSDWLWQREDQMEVAHGQQFGFACSQPCFCGGGLALGTVAIAAGIVGDVLMCAVLTARDMATERRRAAPLDRGHHLQLRRVQMPGMVMAIGRPMGAEDIRDLQLCPATRQSLLTAMRGIQGRLRRAFLALFALGCRAQLVQWALYR